MRRTPIRRLLPLSIALIALPGCSPGDAAEAAQGGGGDAALESYGKARAALDSAVAALGGEARLRQVVTTELAASGTTYGRGQSANPDAPYTEQPLSARLLYDGSLDRTRVAWRTTFRGGLTQDVVRVFAADTGWTHDRSRGALTPMTAFGASLFRAPATYPPRLLPAHLALAALNGAASLRWSAAAGEPPRFSFSDPDGFVTTLELDPTTMLPAAALRVGSDPVRGDVQTEVRYAEYREVDGIATPHTIRFLGGGEVLTEWAVTDVGYAVDSDSLAFAPPAGLELHTFVQRWVPNRIADGVWWIRMWAGAGTSYNSLLVEFDDHFVLVEAPLSDLLYPVISGVAGSIAPEKPVRFVVPTHYHTDHSNGLRALLANGATAVVGPTMADYLRGMASAHHTLQANPLADVDVDPLLRVFRERETLTDGRRVLDLYQIGPGPHVDEMVIAHLPEEGILFVSDLFAMPDAGSPPPPTESHHDFARVLDELDLNVQTIVGGHGVPGTLDDLRRWLDGGPRAAGAGTN